MYLVEAIMFVLFVDSILFEAISRLQWRQFVEVADLHKYPELFGTLKQLQTTFGTDGTLSRNLHTQCSNHIKLLLDDFQTFVQTGAAKSPLFQYWDTFLTVVYPILRDLIRADRSRNWELHVSTFRRALKLFFAFNRINYARWGSVYYEDCLRLPTQLPAIYEDFKKGNFNVTHGRRQFSSVAMDQALEQMYNKPAKSHGGIIGMTRRKKAVAQRDLIKHEKGRIAQFLRLMTGHEEDDEYSLHHEFSPSITQTDERSIRKIMAFILEHGNPFSADSQPVRNIVTGSVHPQETASFLLTCVSVGDETYRTFAKERLHDKTVPLHAPIKKIQPNVKARTTISAIDVKKETSAALRCIDICRDRGYSINRLLSYELTSTSLYFTTADGFLKKGDKSELVRELEKRLLQPPPVVLPESHYATATIFDFMLHARAVTSGPRAEIKTFADLGNALVRRFRSLWKGSTRIDVVFDVYSDSSIKSWERLRRYDTASIEIKITAVTPVPKDWKTFWPSLENKTGLQCFFVNFCCEDNPFGETMVYLSGAQHASGVLLKGSEQLEVDALKCRHEEADERIFVHVQHALMDDKMERVVIASSDTDVVICSMYYYLKAFTNLGLQELWVILGSGQKHYLPVHTLVHLLDNQLVESLPALHALTGCDTTSKLGTKHAALVCASNYYKRLSTFGKTELTEEIMDDIEAFAASLIRRNYTSFDELRVYLYHHMKNMSFEKIPPTSSSVRLHIKRAYLQCYRWCNVLMDVPELNPLDYGYTLCNEVLMPCIILNALPHDFPVPCSCKKCARVGVCTCRGSNIACCRFCTCEGDALCRNPVKP